MHVWSCKQPNLLNSSGRGSTGTILGWYRDAERDSKLLQFLLRFQYGSNLDWGSAETSKSFRCAFGTAKSPNLLPSSGQGSTGIILGWYRDAEQDLKLLQFLLRLKYSSNQGLGSAETSKWIQNTLMITELHKAQFTTF